jgi:hypothetical protein
MSAYAVAHMRQVTVGPPIVEYLQRIARLPYQTETRSHTKMRVSPGAITFPAPRSP